MTNVKQGGTLLILALLSLPYQLHAAPSSFDIDVKELDRPTSPAPKASQPAARYDIDVNELDRTGKGTPVKAEKKKARKEKKETRAIGKGRKQHKEVAAEGDYVRYTVKPGDHIFKILVVRFGMSNEAAERLVPEIIRINEISNIKNLTVGRTLLIPTAGRRERAARAEAAPAPLAAAQPTVKIPAQPAVPAAQPAPQPAASAIPAPAPAAPVAKAPAAPADKPQPAAPKAAPVVAAPVAPAPAPAAQAPAASATPAAAASLPPAPPAPVPNAWVCSVTGKDPAQMVDSVMNALSLNWSKNRVIHSAEGAPNAYSIRVDRYFERNGMRYVVSIGESDPYSYTLLRLLESAGYRVLMINAGDDFKAICQKLLRLVGVTPDFGKHPIQGGLQFTGFLVPQEDAEGRRVVITSEAADPKAKWTLPLGCGLR